MLISREKVGWYLKKFLDVEDQRHIGCVADLTLAATIALEFGFQSPKEKQAKAKATFLRIIAKVSECKQKAKAAEDENSGDYDFDCVFPLESRLPTVEDLATVVDIFHKFVLKDKSILAENMLEWLSDAWDAGAYQQRVYSMEIEGGIMNEYGIVNNFGALLAMEGASKGLLPN